MKSKVSLIFVLVSLSVAYSSSIQAIDREYHKSVLNKEECVRQISFIRENTLLEMQFVDAGIRSPRGVFIGNVVDLGNYHQCLGITQQVEDLQVQGKYCSINLPMDQNFTIPFPLFQEWPTFNPSSWDLDKDVIDKYEKEMSYSKRTRTLNGILNNDGDIRSIENNPLSGTVFSLAMCIPKQCSTHDVINDLILGNTGLSLDFTEVYCRLPDDKPWSGADTAAVIVFSIVGILTLVSTCYDLTYRFVLKKDIKNVNVVYQACSVYTNSQRLMTFSSGSGNLDCIDGIRAISMIWIIVGHAFGTEPRIMNGFDVMTWVVSWEALWVSFGHVAVDTFLLLSGILIIYTSATKITGSSLLKGLHWFYLGRLVRIMPLLALTVLLQASYFNRMTDGPVWENVEAHTNRCRDYWWSTLLHIQNWLHPRNMCVPQSWYVAIDIQFYTISPLVLYWVLGGKKRTAWLALIGTLIVVLIISTAYIFHLNVPSGLITPARPDPNYSAKYYFNTVSRAPPFFVGLIFGYILHINRKKEVHMHWVLPVCFWAAMGAIVGYLLYFNYIITQMTWDNEFMDNFMNSFMRPIWAVVVGVLIFTCVHGYSGPVNWFLSLDIWRLPARLSYGMYLFHYPLMFTINATMITPIYFSVELYAFKALAHIALSILVSFFFTVMFDSPFSVLYRHLIITVQKKKQSPIETKPTKDDISPDMNNINNESKVEVPVNFPVDKETDQNREMEQDGISSDDKVKLTMTKTDIKLVN